MRESEDEAVGDGDEAVAVGDGDEAAGDGVEGEGGGEDGYRQIPTGLSGGRQRTLLCCKMECWRRVPDASTNRPNNSSLNDFWFFLPDSIEFGLQFQISKILHSICWRTICSKLEYP